MGLLEDLGSVPTAFLEKIFDKGYFIYLVIIAGVILIWVLSK